MEILKTPERRDSRPPLADRASPLTIPEVGELLRQAAQRLRDENARAAAPSPRGRLEGETIPQQPLEVVSMETTLYTLGHSTHLLPHVLALLAQHGITAVADVRSMPYSRRSPQWNRESLWAALASHHIASVHGGELGARPTDPSCYVAGRVQYARLAATPAFQHGLTRLQDGCNATVSRCSAQKKTRSPVIAPSSSVAPCAPRRSPSSTSWPMGVWKSTPPARSV